MFYVRFIYSSLRARLLSTILTTFIVAISLVLLLGVDMVRKGARQGFQNTISQTDLVVGARGGSLQLILYSVFRLGSATQNISFASYQKYANHAAVKWTIPYSLGDSHRGFRVVGTTAAFYEHFRFHEGKSLKFAKGQGAQDLFDIVLGSEVAQKCGYDLGTAVTLTHGVTEGRGIIEHGDKPFRVVGILEATGTPVDRSLYMTLQGLEALHVDWQDGAPPIRDLSDKKNTEKMMPSKDMQQQKFPIQTITAFLLGAHSRIDTLRLQREINTDAEEPLMAVIPGVALAELWDTMGYAEEILLVVAGFVVLSGLLGVALAIYNSLEARRREMSVLRALGARARDVFLLLVGEAFFVTFSAVILGLFLLYGAIFLSRPFILSRFGVDLPMLPLDADGILICGATIFVGFFAGILPFVKAYKNLLQDGLAVRFCLFVCFCFWGFSKGFAQQAVVDAKASATTGSSVSSRAVVTLPFLQELVEGCSCGQVQASALLHLGDDFHHFALLPSHRRMIEAATWVGYVHPVVEPWIVKVLGGSIKNANVLSLKGKERPVVFRSLLGEEDLLAPLQSRDGVTQRDGHIWHSHRLVKKMVGVVGNSLEEVFAVRGSQQSEWKLCQKNLLKDLDSLYEQTRNKIASVPQDKRIIVSEHDAFSYFAREHDFRVVALRSPGLGHGDALSPRDLRTFLLRLKQEKVRVFFFDETNYQTISLINQVKALVGIKASTGVLIADGPAGSSASTRERERGGADSNAGILPFLYPKTIGALWLHNAEVLARNLAL